MPKLYDITLPIADDMLVYPGNPPVEVESAESIAAGAAANVTRLSFGSHTGTHVDAARHFIEGGQTVDELPLERLIGPAVVIHIDESVRAIGPAELAAHLPDGADRVLLRTGNSRRLARPTFDADFAHLTAEGAAYLAGLHVLLVGIDYLSVERFGDESHATHLALLEREIVILEGVDLRAVPAGRYELMCLPLKVRGIDGAPARAVLRAD